MNTRKANVNSFARRIIMAILLVVSCFGLCFLTSGKAYAKTYSVKSASDWKKIGTYNGGTFKLTKNIKLTNKKQYLTITKNKKYVIDLNGHKITTSYAGTELRGICPLTIKKGTVVLQSPKSNKGVLYSTEQGAVHVEGSAKFYFKSGMIVNDAVEFRSDLVFGVALFDNARCYLQGSSKIQSINHGVIMNGKSKLYLTGHPYIRAGAMNTKMNFTHYGSGISVLSPGCTLSLKGGSIGTKATPDTGVSNFLGSYNYVMSGDYPIYDKNGKTLKAAKGYKFVDYKKKNVAITSTLDSLYPGAGALFGGDKRLTTKVADPKGFYTIYIVKK